MSEELLQAQQQIIMMVESTFRDQEKIIQAYVAQQ